MQDGVIDTAALQAMMDETVGSVVMQSPNYFGNLEDADLISEIVHKQPKALLIAAMSSSSCDRFITENASASLTTRTWSEAT